MAATTGLLEAAIREQSRFAERINRAANIVSDADIDWSKYELPEAEQARVRSAISWRDDVVQHFLDPESARGAYMPWAKMAGQFRVRPGELTVWSGYNGHRKSMMLNQVMLALMQQSERVLIASLEMRPVQTLARMARQSIGVLDPSVPAIDAMFAWMRPRLWLYDQLGTVMANRMIALARYAREEIGAQHVVIDSLMKCGIASDDYGGQKSFVDKLSTLAKDTNLHIHLVAHARKGEDESRPPNKMDISGTADLTNMADNVITVWVNKKKFAAQEAGNRDLDEKPDAMLTIEKQRNGEYEGRCNLWFHSASMQFHARDGEHAINYLEERAS